MNEKSFSYIMVGIGCVQTITLYELNNYVSSKRIILSEASRSSSAFEMKWKPK